jgi:hypothetical protein
MNAPIENPGAYFHFTQYAMRMNELPEGLAPHIARTDARLRPDMRAWENGEARRQSADRAGR